MGEQRATSSRVALVAVRPLETAAELAEASALLASLWREPNGAPPVSSHLLRAMALTGNYVHGAFPPGGGLVGVTFAWAAPGRGADLHSHITGVLARWQGRGVGRALKLHQREWALRHGFTTVSWTFDPLVARNAWFNLARLGARPEAYLPDLYGEMSDGSAIEHESDRFLVRWEIEAELTNSPHVVSERERPALLAAGPAGEPVPGSPPPSWQEATVEIPHDIAVMRRDRPELAAQWRAASRQVFSAVLAGGGKVLGLDGARRYVLAAGADR